MLNVDIPISMTASSGIASQNTNPLVSCLLKLILINSATTTSTYDFKIIDRLSNIVYHKEGITGTLRENIEVPLRDINTLRVESCDNATEVFTGKITVREA